jgi:polar amino acid transport system substrate-binding protein
MMKNLGLIFILIINFLLFFKINAEEWVGGCLPDYQPYSYFEEGKDHGIDIEIITLVMKNLNIPFKIEYFPWARIMYLLETAKITFSWPMVGTAERSEKFNLVGPIRNATNVFAVPKRSSIKYWSSLNDFKGKIVGVARGYKYSPDFDTDSTIIREESNDVKTLVVKVANSRVDAIIGDSRTISYFIKKLNLSNEIRILQKNINISVRYAAFPKSEKEKSDLFRKSLDVVLKSKNYQNIFKKYSPLL